MEGRGGPNGGVWVSVKHLPDNLFTYYQQWYESGLGFKSFDPKNFLPDLRRDAVEAAPAAHFWCGGITIDRNCRTTLPGLYAAGECSGGLHGANRLSGNAMAEIIAMGNIAGQVAASDAAVRRFSEAPGSSYFDKCEAFFSSRDGEDALTLKKACKNGMGINWPNSERRNACRSIICSKEYKKNDPQGTFELSGSYL